MNEVQLAQIVVDNSNLLDREATAFSLKVCKTDDRGSWTFFTQTWMHGRAGRTEDEIDDDIDGPYIQKQKLKKVAISDVHDAMKARDDLIYMINRCRMATIPFEEALAISTRINW